jgi:hypothetical protein
METFEFEFELYEQVLSHFIGAESLEEAEEMTFEMFPELKNLKFIK